MNTVDQFILNFDGQQRDILATFHQLLSGDLQLTDKIRFNIPFYYRNSWICYLNPIKNNGIELAFTRGNELFSHPQLFEFKGRKQIRGIELFRLADIPYAEIMEMIHEAILLDETTPYAPKRKRKST